MIKNIVIFVLIFLLTVIIILYYILHNKMISYKNNMLKEISKKDQEINSRKTELNSINQELSEVNSLKDQVNKCNTTLSQIYSFVNSSSSVEPVNPNLISQEAANLLNDITIPTKAAIVK